MINPARHRHGARRRRFALEALESRRVMATYTLQILHASDAEAGLATIDDAPRFAAAVDLLEETHPNSILVSGGDNYLPGPFFNASGDASVGAAVLGGAGNASIGRGDIEIMNRIGFEVSAMGNHEFDLGTREIRNLFQPSGTWQGGQFPYLSANVNFSAEPDLNNRLSSGGLEAATIKGRIAPSAIITENGEKIGIVGLTTPEILSISSPGSNVAVTPASGTYDLAALASVVNSTVDALEAQGVNKVILLSHLQQFVNEVQLAPLLNGVDVIIAAGSNTISADATDTLRSGDTIEAPYPWFATGADGNPSVIVSTDAGYRYLGRMVVTFNESGVLDPGSIDPVTSGAFATDDQGLINLGLDPVVALTTGKAAAVKQVTDAIEAVILSKDGNLFGQTDVFLEGRRVNSRTQETNLGNLTADANLSAARLLTGDTSIGISLKNGGGIRDSIGSFPVYGDPGPPAANPDAGKAVGDISQLDIENSLRFNNGLSVVSLTGAELVRLMEHGFADSRPGNTPGRFPQVGGMTLEVDLSKPTGDRLRRLVATDVTGASVTVVQGGVVTAPAASFRMVTLGFLADGGDGYPFSSLAALQRVNLAPATGNAFTTSGSEQDALADYLAANFPAGGSAAFTQPETPPRQDRRIVLTPAPDDAIQLSAIATVSVPGGAEISAYDPSSARLFVTKNDGGVPSLDIIDLTNPSSPVVVGNATLAAFGASISSVAVKNGVVAAAMIAGPKTNPGAVVFLDVQGVPLGSVQVGAVPDMLTFTPDGAKVLVAIEGEAADNADPDDDVASPNPQGGVSIITLDKSNVAGGSLSLSPTQFAGFTAFNGQKDALRAAGVRLLANSDVSVAMDLEPEYLALSPDGLTARVTLQENNALGILDMAAGEFIDIQPLGHKDHSRVGNEFDGSDRDGPGTGGGSQRIAGNLKNWPVKGVYMPDAIASFTVAGQTYYVTANEGDARPNAADTADTDVTRVGSIASANFDPAVFDAATVAFLKNEDNLGRLNVLTAPGDSDANADGKIDRLLSLGGRSFSIWNSLGQQVFDSGAELERLTFALTPAMFNANDGISSAVDQRSDDKGPEPEGVVTGVVNGRTYAFVGLERTAGGVMVYDVTNPANPTFVQYAFRNNQDASAAGDDVSPEGLVFISSAESPNGSPLLVVSNEVSGTVTIYQLTASPVINEFVANHTGTDTREFIEVLASPLADLSSLTLLQVEGDNSGAVAGVVKSVHPLTTADAQGLWTTGFLSNVLENGTFTLLLVRGFSGAVGDDYDANNDGVLDASPWSTVLDTIAVNDGGASDRVYSTVSLGTAFAGGFAPGGASRIPHGADTNQVSDWRLNDFDGAGLDVSFPGTARLGEAYNTPGAANVDVVPLDLTIPAIQGAGHLSDYAHLPARTTGVVTARASNGFYLQTPVDADANSATSEGLFVFTNSAPPAAAAVGALLRVNGTVKEFGFANALTITELVDPVLETLAANQPLPTPTLLGAAGRIPPNSVIDNDGLTSFDSVTDGIDFYESLEGMLVQVNDALAVSSNARFGEIAIVADGGAGAGPRTNNGGVRITSADFNPERILVDDALIDGVPEVQVGDQLGTVQGVIDYSFGNYKLLNVQPLVVSPGAVVAETSSFAASLARLRVASFNVEDLDGADPQVKFDAVAVDIVTGLRSPDIVALQEIQDSNGAVDDGTTSSALTAQRLIDSIVAAGGPAYLYADIAPVNNQDGGEPGANIRPGFLYNPSRVSLVAGSLTQVSPADPAFLDSRKPLAATFLFHGQAVTLVNNHFNSKTGDTPLFGSSQPPILASEPQRLAQAAIVKSYVDGLLLSNPLANVAVLGDLNDFEFSAPLATLTNGGNLVNLHASVSAGDRYTYNFDGNSQVLDHILVSPRLATYARADAVHLNADFPASEQSSDHDPVVAEFLLPGVAVHEGTLYLVGTPRADVYKIAHFRGGQAIVAHPAARVGTFEGVERIVALLDDGADRITITSLVSPTVVIDGGAGNDNLISLAGPSFLLGGSGDDTLNGGGAADILIGGEGRDRLLGNDGDDLLVGGDWTEASRLDQILAALAAWGNSGLAYPDRVAAVEAAFFSAETLREDVQSDELQGQRGQDWFIAAANDLTPGRRADEILS